MDSWDQIWRPLDPSKRQIRVFVLEPCARYDSDGYLSCEPPSGRLEIVSLDDQPHYDAISYSWGVAADFRPIYLNGRRWPITMNLWKCLLYLRDSENERILWCDAFCIHQFDKEERSAQVQIMQHIFMDAQAVRVWLGVSGKKIVEAMQIIKRVSSGAEVTSGQARSGRVNIDSFNSLSTFTSSSWWSRLWVVQEVALARQVYFHAGDFTMNASRIDAFLHSYSTTVRHSILFAAWWKGLDEEQQKSYFHFIQNLRDIKSIRTMFESDLVEQSFPQYSMKSRATDVLYNLAASRKRQVTHVRDHIYGNLGLCTVLLKKDLIRPDYTSEASQVYIEFAFSFLTASRCLVLLGQSSYIHNSMMSLPSWVPDWSSNYYFSAESRRSRDFNNLFKACGSIPMKISRTVDQVLQLSGYFVDTIIKVGIVYEEDVNNCFHSNLLRSLNCWENLCMPGISDHGSDQFYITGTTMWEAFRRSVFRDVMSFGIDKPSKRISASSTQAEYSQTKGSLAEENNYALTPTGSTMVDAISKSRMIITTKGFIELAPPEGQIGDSVFLLAGGDVPYVLRPDHRYTGSTTYRFVGECYIHGIMDGELVHGPDALQARDVYLS